LYDILKILFERGHKEPLVYKKLDGNKFEKEVFERFPSLVGKVFDLKDNTIFNLKEDNMIMKALYTPGHATDHFSMLLTPNDQTVEPHSYLFSGDIIMGTPSTSV
jgi:glyoxylase-like metal-dependent hydrolase (beta-lactamase superfamily II)